MRDFTTGGKPFGALEQTVHHVDRLGRHRGHARGQTGAGSGHRDVPGLQGGANEDAIEVIGGGRRRGNKNKPDLAVPSPLVPIGYSCAVHVRSSHCARGAWRRVSM